MNIWLLLRTSQEGIVKVQAIVMSKVLLLLLLLVLELLMMLEEFLRGWNEDGYFNFLDHLNGMGDHLFDDFLDRHVHNFIFILHHGVWPENYIIKHFINLQLN